MDGLEAVEIPFRDITFSLRLDAECYEKKYLLANTVVDSLQNTVFLGELCSKITQGSNPSFAEEGLSCLNGKNVYWGKITPNECNFVTEQEFARLSSFALKKDDVVITLKHASKVGRSWIIKENTPKIFGRNIGLLRLKKDSEILPTTLVFYLWTSLVQVVIENMATGGTNGQITLPISAIKKLKIPRFSDVFQKKICEFYEISAKTASQSTTLYSTAEVLVLSHLGLADYNPSKEPVAIKSFSSSFGVTGRLDSEYYQPKYEEIEKRFKNQDTVGTICTLHDNNFTPDEKVEYRYIELSNIGKSGEISGVETTLGAELPTRARRLVAKGQVIVSSIEGSLESCALIGEEYNNALCSTGFYVVSSEQMNSETLLTIFKCSAIQMLMKKRCSGTILTAMNKDEFLALPMPTVDSIVQKEIAEKVQQSFALRKKSAELLELAKTAVEVAIEQGEEKALSMLKEVML